MSDQKAVNEAQAEKVPSSEDKIVCHIDNARVHSIHNHIRNNYAETWTVERYKAEFPDEPLLSDYAKHVLMERKRKREAEAAAVAPSNAATPGMVSADGQSVTQPAMIQANLKTFHDVFDLGEAPAARNANGNPIQIDVLSGHNHEGMDYLPEIDEDYVFNIDLLKKVIIGLQLNMPVYLWGYHGTGKTTILEQASARTKRPFVRVQHTLNMQESDVLGQWTVRDGSTVFQLGPLAMAMINGWTYCADEYDTAMPNVTTVYQPVLEGKPLLIKEAPPHFRKIVPHPQFRFCATGNTNGIGDETGLYQGTLMQNAANYSRFRITEEVPYMEANIETAIIQARAKIAKKDAERIVRFARDVRQMFMDGKISMTVSPRELITAAQLGLAYGRNWRIGLELAFVNRLSRVDRQTVGEYMQRIFG
jgi:cobaltochelatase CobS